MNQITMETSRLLLRPWEDADAGALYKYASDPLVGPAAGWQPHRSEAESLTIIRTVLSEPETYAVVLKESGEPVGSIGLMTPRTQSGDTSASMELGYWLARPLWGQGLIPEAAAALLERAFTALNCTKLYCAYFEGNSRSARVGEKCGFVYDHTEQVLWTPPEKTLTEHFTLLTRERWLERQSRCGRNG